MNKYDNIFNEVKRIIDKVPPDPVEPFELDFSARIGNGFWFDRISIFPSSEVKTQ